MERVSLLVGVGAGVVELNETMTTPLAVRYAGNQALFVVGRDILVAGAVVAEDVRHAEAPAAVLHCGSGRGCWRNVGYIQAGNLARDVPCSVEVAMGDGIGEEGVGAGVAALPDTLNAAEGSKAEDYIVVAVGAVVVVVVVQQKDCSVGEVGHPERGLAEGSRVLGWQVVVVVGLRFQQNPDLFEKRALEDGLSSCLELNTSCKNSKKLLGLKRGASRWVRPRSLMAGNRFAVLTVSGNELIVAPV